MIFKNIAPAILEVVVGSKIQYMQIQSLHWKFIIFQRWLVLVLHIYMMYIVCLFKESLKVATSRLCHSFLLLSIY